MPYAQTDYENQARAYLDDNGRRVVDELTNYVVGGNGNRKAFYLSKGNILNAGATLVQFDQNMAGFTTTGIASVDTTNGIVNFTAAPALSSSVPTSLFISYWYQEFLNTDIDNYVNYGLNKINYLPLSDPAQGWAGVAPMFFNVVCMYAAAAGNKALASRYAKLVDIAAEGTSSGKSKIPDMYLKIAQEWEDAAEKERLAVNGPAQGRATKVSSTAKRFIPANQRRIPYR